MHWPNRLSHIDTPTPLQVHRNVSILSKAIYYIPGAFPQDLLERSRAGSPVHWNCSLQEYYYRCWVLQVQLQCCQQAGVAALRQEGRPLGAPQCTHQEQLQGASHISLPNTLLPFLFVTKAATIWETANLLKVDFLAQSKYKFLKNCTRKCAKNTCVVTKKVVKPAKTGRGRLC